MPRWAGILLVACLGFSASACGEHTQVAPPSNVANATAPQATPTTGGFRAESDEATAYARARAEGKGVLTYFTATWCAPCEELERNFASPAVRQTILASFVPLRIDATEDSDRVTSLRERYKATTMPAVVMTDVEGNELGRITELLAPDQLAATIRPAADKLRSSRR